MRKANSLSPYDKMYVVYGEEIKKFLEEVRVFVSLPEEIRWDYCDCFEEYVLRHNGVILSGIYNPSEFSEKYLNTKLDTDISIADFDKAVADKFCLWNYPLSESSELVGREDIVAVKFSDDTIRLVETK